MNLLHRAVFAIRHCMTGDQGHYHLNQMKITKYVAQATNGWIAVEVQTNGDDPMLFPSEVAGMKAIGPVDDSVEEIRISKETAEGIFKALPKNGHIPVLQNAMVGADGEDAVLAVTDLDSSRIFKTHGPDANFPDLDAVRPKEEPLATFTVDAYLLYEFLKVIRDFKGLKREDSPLLFEVYEKEPGNTPLSVHAKNDTGQRLRALVMPMHGHNPDDFRFQSEEQIEAQRKAAKEAAELRAVDEAVDDGGEDNSYVMEEDDPTQQDALQELAESQPPGPYEGDDVMRTPKPDEEQQLPGIE